MVRRRTATMPLHGGKAPAWLFRRMTKLAGAMTMAIVDEFGPAEMLRRLSDPWWFQAFGCVLGFDWHSSGVTTVTCGAMKEAFRQIGPEMGLMVAGGKGGVSRKTPDEISAAADEFAVSMGDQLIENSRTAAKVDSAAVQDGYRLYQHCFFFTQNGEWCVVQQGMNEDDKSARRYHWLGESVTDFVCEPHSAISDLVIATARKQPPTRSPSERKPGQRSLFDPPDELRSTDMPGEVLLNMVAEEAADNRKAAVRMMQEHPDRILREIELMTEGPSLFAPTRHRVLPRNINPGRLQKLIPVIHEQLPQDYRQLLSLEGVGPSAVRSLALIAELIYQAPVSHRDPAAGPRSGGTAGAKYIEDSPAADDRIRRWADYSHAHGGKDGTPFPVDRTTYDRNIHILTESVRHARMGDNDRADALRRISRLTAGDG
ncbi:MAG: DUF763 domain-containing protein [Planctomycetaceae bacterium]|nr:DUF763 domain-containing protein [Planctomycetaceae bacterium]